jgi:hypothetical protein
MKKTIDFIEFSRKGGNTTMERHGSEHYTAIAKKAHKSITKKYGKDHWKKIRAIGVEKQRKAKEEAKRIENQTPAEYLVDVFTGKKGTNIEQES